MIKTHLLYYNRSVKYPQQSAEYLNQWAVAKVRFAWPWLVAFTRINGECGYEHTVFFNT